MVSRPHWSTVPCDLWTGPTNGRYGLASRRVYVHRKAWEETYGPIPDGLDVCHHCDTPLCREPLHLFLGTRSDNMADARAKGRWTPYHPQPGEANGRARLTEEEALTIRQRCRPNGTGQRGGEWTVSAAARRYRVSRTTIRGVLKGATWQSA
jgi:hypothetical protein